MIGERLDDWFELIVFIVILLLSVYVLSVNEIKHLRKVYVLFHIATLLWPFGQFSINMTDNLTYQWAYLNVSFIGVVLLSYLWLVISFLFTQDSNGMRKVYMRLAALPPLVIVSGITLNPVFGWFVQPRGDSYVFREYGPMFWALVCMAGLYLLIGCLLLLLTLQERDGAMRKQSLLLITGQVLLVVCCCADVVLNVGVSVGRNISPGLTSAGILASYLCFAIAVQRYSVYKVISIAHDTAIDSMESGFVVLSDRNIVIDMNQTARRFIPVKIGQPFPIDRCVECMDTQDSEDFLHVYNNKPKASIQAELSSYAPTIPHVLMRIQPIHDRRQVFIGRMVTFQDITEWRSMVEELNTKNQDLSIRNKELTIIQEELSSVNKKLELMATTDSLTGCYNRRYLFQMMEYQISFDRRYQIPYSIILLDIDYFKQTNDTYGHQVGDKVLKQTAELISSRLRQTDIFARYGGEEFLIFLPHTKHEYAVKLAEQLRSLVERNTVQTDQGSIGITISIGIASSDDEGVHDIEDVKSHILEMVARADDALYHAKHQGRNRVAIAALS